MPRRARPGAGRGAARHAHRRQAPALHPRGDAEPCFGPYADDGDQAHQGPAGPARRDPRLRRPAPARARAAGRAARRRRPSARARAGDAADLDPALAARHAARARPGAACETLARLPRRRAAALLFERFLELWRELEREGFRARLSTRSASGRSRRRPLSPSDNGDQPSAAVASPTARDDRAADDPRRPAAEPGPSRARRRDLDDPRLYFNRELSWLEFNERVLELAEDDDVPLLERAEVLRDLLVEPRRVLHGPRRRPARPGRRRHRRPAAPTAARRRETLDAIARARPRARRAPDALLGATTLRPALAEHGIRIVGCDDVDAERARGARRALPAPDLPGAHAARRRPRAAVPVHLEPLAVARACSCATRRRGTRPSRA